MPIQDNNGKVIVSLLAGATAGIVAGLLIAPETGEDTRKTLAQGADKLWHGSLGSKLKEVIARFSGPTGPGANTSAHADKQAANSRLQTMSSAEPGDLSTPAGAGNGRSVEGDREDGVGEGRS